MDSTQKISDSLLESDDEENEGEIADKRGKPLAKLFILKNEHIPETELPLFLGDNVLGRDPSACTLVLSSPSVSKEHANICISRYRRRGSHGEVDMEALVWDKGSMNGTRKGRLKLTPNVRYALNEGDSLVVADIPCQYVSCTVDAACFQWQSRTMVSRQSGAQAGMPIPLRKGESDTSTAGKTWTKGGTNAPALLSSPDLEDTKKTQAQRSCLTLEQTPTHPEGTLVPESESDSDGEREGTRSRGQIATVSDAESHVYSPTCSTFLTLAKTIIPESEDESSINHSFTKNRPGQHVSVCKDQADVDTTQQQLTEKNEQGLVVDGKEEERKEEKRAASGGREAEQGGGDVPVKQNIHDSLTGEDEIPVSASAVPMDLMPVFNMDSDSDAEEEEGVVSAGSVAMNANQVNTVHFHMENDTDVDEDGDSLDKVPKSVPFCDDGTKSPRAPPLIQLPDTALDSDTDVDDIANTAGSDDATKASPASLQKTADCVPFPQLKEFHLDSDTDFEDEKEESGTNKTGPKMVEILTTSDLKPVEFETTLAAPQNLGSDTDDEVIPAISKSPAAAAASESCITAAAGTDLEILSNSDTDLEDDAPALQPAVVKVLSVTPVAALTSLQSDSDADTDVDESNVPSAGDSTDLRLDNASHLENKQCGEGHILQPGQTTSGLPVSEVQMCSTPRQFSGELAEMETQGFLSPSLEPLKRTAAPTVRPASCSDSQDDEDCVAETQSFIVESRDCLASPPDEPTQAFVLDSSGDENYDQSKRGGSFQLGLSDSNHLQCQAQALAMESTQAYVDGSLSLEETQEYAPLSSVDNDIVHRDSSLEVTQACGGGEDPTESSAKFEKDDWEELALQATQAYIPELYSVPNDESKEDEVKNIATAETRVIEFPTTSTLTMTETQAMFALEEEKNGTKDKPLSSVQHVPSKKQNETKDGQEHGDAAKNLDKPISEGVFIAETQPMAATDDEESDDNDDYSFPGPQKRKAKPLRLEEEATQSFTNFQVSAVDTQPSNHSHVKIQPSEDDKESVPGIQKPSTVNTQLTHDGNVNTQSTADDEDSFPVQRRRAKPLPLKEEDTQVSAADTQAMHIDNDDETHHMSACEKEERDNENSIPRLRKRKAKPLPLEEEATQTYTNSEFSAVDTQLPHDGNVNTQSTADDEDSFPVQRRRAKPLPLEEESTQAYTNSEFSAVDTQLTHDGNVNTQSTADDEDSFPVQRRAKPLPLEEESTQAYTNSEFSAVDTQLTHDGNVNTQSTADDEDSFPVQRRRAKPLPLEEEDTQVSAADTQPMHIDDETQAVHALEKKENDKALPGSCKRKEKPQEIEEEEMEPLKRADLPVADTQPMHISDDDDDENQAVIPCKKDKSNESIQGSQNRKAKLLEVEEEASRPPRSSELSIADTQPMHLGDDEEQAVNACKKDESNDDESIQVSRNRKAKSIEVEEEASRPLKSSELSVADTQPMQDSDEETLHVATCEDGETDNEGSKSGQLERKAEPELPKEVTQVCAAETQPIHDDEETQPIETNIGIQKIRTQPQSGPENQSEPGTSGVYIKSKKGTREEDEKDEDSALPKKQTRGKGKALSRGKFKPDAVKENEEQVMHARATSPRQQKDEAKERLAMEEEKFAENDSLLKERGGTLGRTGKEVEARRSMELRRQAKGRRAVDKQEQDGRIQNEKDKLKSATMEKQSVEMKEQEKLDQERWKQKLHTRMERELKERAESEGLEKEVKEKLIKGQQENNLRVSTRGRRGGRTSIAAPCTVELKQDSNNDDFPARRTRSRSSSSNSVNSERSASSANTPVSRGRGQGRGANRTSQQTSVTITRNDNRRRTVAEEPSSRRRTAEQDSNSTSPSGRLLRSSSTNFLNSEVSSSTNSQNRGKGYRQGGRGWKTEAQPDAATPVNSDQISAPKTTLRGRKSKKSEGSSSTSFLHEDNQEANSKRCSTTRGQKRANTNGSESTAADGEDQSNQEAASASEALLLLKTNTRGRKAIKRNSLAAPPLLNAASEEDEAKESRRGRKSDLGEEAETLVSTTKNSRGNVNAQKGKRVLDEKSPVSVQAKRRGRPAGESANESLPKVEVKEESDNMEEEIVVRRARGRLSVLHKRKQEPEDSGSMEQDTNVEASEQSQTPSCSASRKRREPKDSSPLAKIPRCSSTSPAAGSRLRAASPACRFCVLFTGVVDEAGERAVVRLGGTTAKGVADMNYLVTDKVRRTVKFLCAVAKGVPIVTTHWLEKSGKAGSFLSPTAFIVKDLEQEKKFNFCLKESLKIASSQPLLQGYEIHVTKSVKPEPVHMKDIISCSGATFLPKMPSSHKPQSVVISCEEDWPLCAPAINASLPIVTAEFILTGILQQKLDFQTHTLSVPAANLQPAGGRGRARKKP